MRLYQVSSIQPIRLNTATDAYTTRHTHAHTHTTKYTNMHTQRNTFRASVYDILSPTIVMIGYAIGFRTLAEFGGRVPERLLGLPHSHSHTPSIAFRHLPPNSARFSYATEGAFFISAQLSSDAVSALRKVRVLI